MTKRDLIIERTQGPSFFVNELDPKNTTNYITIDVTDAAKTAIKKKENVILFEINEYFKRRRAPFPRRITLKDSQNLELYDSKYVLSPFTVET